MRVRRGINVRWLVAMGLTRRAQKRLEDQSREYNAPLDASVWTHFGDMAAHTLLEAIRAELQREFDAAVQVSKGSEYRDAATTRESGERAKTCLTSPPPARGSTRQYSREMDLDLCPPCRERNCNACDGADCRCTCSLTLDLPRPRTPSEASA